VTIVVTIAATTGGATGAIGIGIGTTGGNA
jgi:hypothetical protein